MIRLQILSTAVAMASLLAPSVVPAQENKAESEAAKQQELYEQLAKPGKEHKQLKRLVGTWEADVKYYFDESGKPTASKGTATIRSLMGGRYIQQRFNGEMLGEKFSGMAITGYDNAKKKYVGIWIDDMSTGIMHSEGTYDVKTHTMTEMGTSSSPMGEMKFKNVSRYVSEDEYTFTMFMVSPEGEKKMMDITYKRVKKPAKKKAE